MGFEVSQIEILILDPPLASSVFWGNLFNLSEDIVDTSSALCHVPSTYL